MAEDEMVGWHHRLKGHECEQTLGVGDGQGGLACCSPWCRKDSDTTERLNNSKNTRALQSKLRVFQPVRLLQLISATKKLSKATKVTSFGHARLDRHTSLHAPTTYP